MAFVALGDADRAIADASKAMEFEPRNGEALAVRGNAFRAAGDLRRAIDDYTAAIRFGNDYAETYHVAVALHAVATPRAAITDFKMAIRLRPADSPNSRAELKALGIEAPPFDPNAAPNAKAIMDWLK